MRNRPVMFMPRRGGPKGYTYEPVWVKTVTDIEKFPT